MEALSQQKTNEDGFKRDFINDTCILIAFIAHGSAGKIKMKDKKINVEDEILDPFRTNNCPGLLDKPKIFLFSVRNFFYEIK